MIDELDKLPPQAIRFLYEAMESGRITLNSATKTRELESKFVCLATANPKGDNLADRPGLIRKQLLCSVPVALLSRFHLVFVLKQPGGVELQETVGKILSTTEKDNPHLYFVRNYFQAIKIMRPTVKCELDPSDPSVRKAQEFLSAMIKASSDGRLYAPLWVRAAEALKRLCISGANIRLSPRVEDVDVQNAMSIMKASLATWYHEGTNPAEHDYHQPVDPLHVAPLEGADACPLDNGGEKMIEF